MVSVRGQLASAPLVDIASVRQEYWQRKEVLLPSLKDTMPVETKWWGLRKVRREPKLVLRRLTEEEWRSINERFWNVRDDLAKQMPLLRKLYDKMAKGNMLKQKEMKVLNHSQNKAMPIYKAMLELMIEEPRMNYDEVSLLMDAVDEYDRESLLAYVNTLTAEKAVVAHRINEERVDEMNQMRAEMMAGV